LFSGVEERVQFFNGKLDILHEQQQIGRLSASSQPSLQEADMLQQAMDAVSPLHQRQELRSTVVTLSRRMARL
jgi:hypothetical protein